MEPKGTWYLVLQGYDLSEPDEYAALEKGLEKIELAAGHYHEALAEAINIWQARTILGGYRAPNGNLYPRSPKLVLAFSMPWEVTAEADPEEHTGFLPEQEFDGDLPGPDVDDDPDDGWFVPTFPVTALPQWTPPVPRTPAPPVIDFISEKVEQAVGVRPLYENPLAIPPRALHQSVDVSMIPWAHDRSVYAPPSHTHRILVVINSLQGCTFAQILDEFERRNLLPAMSADLGSLVEQRPGVITTAPLIILGTRFGHKALAATLMNGQRVLDAVRTDEYFPPGSRFLAIKK